MPYLTVKLHAKDVYYLSLGLIFGSLCVPSSIHLSLSQNHMVTIVRWGKSSFILHQMCLRPWHFHRNFRSNFSFQICGNFGCVCIDSEDKCEEHRSTYNIESSDPPNGISLHSLKSSLIISLNHILEFSG